MTRRLRIAVQKSGRISERSISILMKCGLDFDFHKDRLLYECQNFPIDLMLVRDDDIPEYVADAVCDLGVVGLNVLRERGSNVDEAMELGFGACRLSLAIPEGEAYAGIADLNGKRIATSYPNCLRRFMADSGIDARIVELSGSVEIAPKLRIADAVFDLVSTGGTLRSNGLREILPVLKSEAVLIRTRRALALPIAADLERLIQRIEGVIRATRSKYILMNAPRAALPEIQSILPGMEEPSILPLAANPERIAIHAVASENIFWDTIERLKAVGASGILVLPIEKVIR